MTKGSDTISSLKRKADGFIVDFKKKSLSCFAGEAEQREVS